MSPPAHVLIIPYPAQGHLLPLIDFTHQLLLHHDITATIVITPGNLPAISSLLSAHPSSVKTLTLPFPSHPFLPRGIENVRDLGWIGNLYMISALPQLASPIAEWYHAQPDPPVALIADFFLGWTKKLAKELEVKHFTFCASGGFFNVVGDYLWNHEEVRKMEECTYGEIPGSPTFKLHELPSLYRFCDKTTPEWKGVKEVLLQNALPTNLIINSFYALESRFFDHLRKIYSNLHVFAVGPVSLRGLNHGQLAEKPELSWIFDWLDFSPVGSVLYISFGSQKYMSEEQLKGLAMGLEKSGTRFVWVVKLRDDGCNLPSGFEERVSGRGLVVRDWAPQVRILRHRAVGGFLSHCGWNSTLEAIEAGVPLLAWPMEAEQYLNAKLLESELEVAFRVCEGVETVPDPDQLTAVIRKWHCEGENELRLRASQLKDMALAAVEEGGSSSDDLEKLSMLLLQ